MVPIEKAEQILAELMDELPDAFFQELNGGVCLYLEDEAWLADYFE